MQSTHLVRSLPGIVEPLLLSPSEEKHACAAVLEAEIWSFDDLDLVNICEIRMSKMSLSFCEYGRGKLKTRKLIKNLVVDCTDMKWGVSASIPRVHVRPVEQQVL